jgi:hypothetical protein
VMSSITSAEVEWVFGVMKNGDGASLARVGNHRHMLIASDDVETETGGRGGGGIERPSSSVGQSHRRAHDDRALTDQTGETVSVEEMMTSPARQQEEGWEAGDSCS